MKPPSAGDGVYLFSKGLREGISIKTTLFSRGSVSKWSKFPTVRLTPRWKKFETQNRDTQLTLK